MATASDPWGVSSVLQPLAATHDGSHLSGAALMPYLGSLSNATYGDPTFQSMDQYQDHNQSGPDFMGNQSIALGWAGGMPKVEGDQTYGQSTDLSQLLGDMGGKVKAPDWNQFYTAGHAAGRLTANNDSQSDMGEDPNNPAVAASYDTAGATKAYWDWQKQLATAAGLDPNGKYIYDNQTPNPTSAAGSRDTVAGIYGLNSQTGTYDPVIAANQHHNSNWMDNRDFYTQIAMGVGSVLTAGAAAGAFGAAGGAVGGGTAAGSGMTSADLAALYGDAGYGAGVSGAATGAAGGTAAGTTAADIASYAKTAYGTYNAASSAAHGDLLGAARGAVGTYAGAGGSDPWGVTSYLNDASKAYGAYQAVQNGNYAGALQSGYGAATGFMGDTTTTPASSGVPKMDDSYTSTPDTSSASSDPYGDYGSSSGVGAAGTSYSTTPDVAGGTDTAAGGGSSGVGSAFNSAVSAASTFQDFLKNNPGLVKTFGSVASLYSAFQANKSQQASTAMQNKSGQAQLDLAQAQWDQNKNTFLPKATQLADQAAGVTTAQATSQAANAATNQGVANAANAQGQKSYEFQNDQMDTARKYASGEMANTFADAANADVQQAAGASKLATEQEMGRRGVNMGSPAALALMNDNQIQTQGMAAGAQTLARREARDKADAMVAAAGGLGTQNFQAGATASGVGVQNTNSAVNAAGAAPTTYGAVSNNFNYGANGAGATLGGAGRTGYGLGGTYGGNPVADYLGGSSAGNVKTGTGTGVNTDPVTGMPKP